MSVIYSINHKTQSVGQSTNQSVSAQYQLSNSVIQSANMFNQSPESLVSVIAVPQLVRRQYQTPKLVSKVSQSVQRSPISVNESFIPSVRHQSKSVAKSVSQSASHLPVSVTQSAQSVSAFSHLIRHQMQWVAQSVSYHQCQSLDQYMCKSLVLFIQSTTSVNRLIHLFISVVSVACVCFGDYSGAT